MTCEDEQAFLDRHFETLQHGSEFPGRKGTGAQTTRPSIVGPLGVSSTAIDLVRTGEDRRLKVKSKQSSEMHELTFHVGIFL